MVQEIQVKTWCDRCVSTGDHVEGHTVTLSSSLWPKPMTIDLCDEHGKIVVDLDQIMTKYGRPDAIGQTKAKAAQPELVAAKRFQGRPLGGGAKKQAQLAADPTSVGCPVCVTLSSNEKSLAGHLRKQHDLLWSAYSSAEIASATEEARAKVLMT